MPKGVNKRAFRKQIGALYDLHPTLVKKDSPELTKTMMCIKSCFVANPAIGDVYNGKGAPPKLKEGEWVPGIEPRNRVPITTDGSSGKPNKSNRIRGPVTTEPYPTLGERVPGIEPRNRVRITTTTDGSSGKPNKSNRIRGYGVW
jgi:hypothetical protein